MCKRETFSLILSHTHSYTCFPHKQALSPVEPFCTLHPPAHLARVLGSTHAGSFLLAQVSGGEQESLGEVPGAGQGGPGPGGRNWSFLFF